MRLEGTLAQWKLRELIELSMYSSVTGVLKLHSGMTQGRVFFLDGRIYHVEAGPAYGELALRLLFELEAAQWSFEHGALSEQRTIWTEALELIDAAERQAQAWRSIRQRLPQLDLVPRLVGGPPQVVISEEDWPYLAAIDGQRSIEQIAEHMGYDLYDVCLALLRLLDRGILALLRPQPAASIPATGSSASAGLRGPRRGSFFERLASSVSAMTPLSPTLPEERDPFQQMLQNRY